MKYNELQEKGLCLDYKMKMRLHKSFAPIVKREAWGLVLFYFPWKSDSVHHEIIESCN